MRQTLENFIQTLKKDVTNMADHALNNLKDGLKAFKTEDFKLAKEVIKRDDLIDRYEEDIAKQALRIIWKEQPLASDLRFVTGVLKLITDIERIGDHATDVAEMTLHLEPQRNLRVLPITEQMAEDVEHMVLESIEALVSIDVAKAKAVIEKDHEVNQLFKKLINKMTSELKHDKIDANEAIYVLMVAKYFERVGDHACNIAEWIIFMDQGTHKDTPLF